MLNTRLGVLQPMTAYSTMFMASAVFPMAGRPAMTMRSEFLKPVVFASKTSKPLDRPGNCPLFSYSLVNSSTALPSMGVTGCGPSFTSRRSAMLKTSLSAWFSRSSLLWPFGSNPESAMRWPARMSCRWVDLSRTMRA